MSPRSMSPTAVLVAVLVIVPASAYAETKAAQGVSAQALKAKTDYCKTCHGVDAQGFRGAAPMPRLAGQQPEYIKNQLQAFIERKRTNPVMNNVAHVLSPEMVTALSEYFNSLNPKPLGGGNPASCRRARRFSKKASRAPTFRRAPRVTETTRRVTVNFHVWRVSFPTTYSAS